MDERSRWYLEALVGRVHTTVMATVDNQGYPRTCAVDMMLADDDGVYFLTARGKSLYRRLSASGRVSVTGISGHDTMSSVALSLTGDAVEVGPDRLPELFEANPYMEGIYPDEGSRSALTVFCIIRGEGEWFDLSKRPIERESFSYGGFHTDTDAYIISDRCDGCGACLASCPQSCIDPSVIPFSIVDRNCLRCGNCMRVCPRGAVSIGGRPL